MGLFKKINGWVNGFFGYWSKPKKGNYIPMKEAMAYCIGGMGIVGGSTLISYVTLTAGAFIAVALGISVRDIWIIGIINSVFVIARSPLISMAIDNTNTKMGKFRPYIMWLTIPIIIGFVAIGNIPFLFDNYTAKLAVFAVLYIVLTTFTTTHTQAFNSMIQVITPNANERDQLMSIGAFMYSLGPSVVGLFFPIFAQLLYGNAALNEPAMYQVYLPIFVAVFYSFSFLIAFFTKERILVSKKYKAKVKFFDSVKKVITNKYFWLSNLGGWLGALKILITGLTAWICIYMLNSSAALGIVATVMGTASVPGMLLAPWLIKKLGKKKLVIITGAIFAIAAVPIIFLVNQPIVILVFLYLMNLANGVNVITGPMMQADIYDYQQWKTGDRLEGFMQNFANMIGTAIGIGTTAIMPFVYDYMGYVQNADVLYDETIRNPIVRWTVIVGIISGVLGIIPIFFYDLSEKKHAEIIEELKARAIAEDMALEAEAGSVGLNPSLVADMGDMALDVFNVNTDTVDKPLDDSVKVDLSDAATDEKMESASIEQNNEPKDKNN